MEGESLAIPVHLLQMLHMNCVAPVLTKTDLHLRRIGSIFAGPSSLAGLFFKNFFKVTFFKISFGAATAALKISFTPQMTPPPSSAFPGLR